MPIADFDQGSLQNFPIGTIVGNSPWVRSHPNTIAAFLRAFQQGQQVADSDRQAVGSAQTARSRPARNLAVSHYPGNRRD